MANTDVITEKVYCNGGGGWGDSGAFWAMQNNWSNNPFAYMMIMGMMRWMYGDNWQAQMPYNAEMQGRFNQLSNQIADNHNADILNDAVKGNSARIGELANNLNIDHRAIQAGICDIRAGLQGVNGEIKFTGERVINSNLLGLKDLQASFKDCCCENKQLVQKMGYESQLAHKDTLNAMGQQTYTLNERLTGIANGLQKGFADIGYILAQNKCDITTNQDRNAQRIIDTLNNHWGLETSQALQDEKFKNSQLQQNLYIKELLEKKNGCGCGAA